MGDHSLGGYAPAPPVSPTSASPTSWSVMDEYLPKVIPSSTTVTITKRSILQLAVVKLGVKLHQIRVTGMNNDDLLGSVCMDVPPHRGCPYTSRKEFFGLYTPSNEEAIESACSAALDYLKTVGLLIIDDANYAELKKCQADLQKAQFWEDAFRTRASTLQAALAKSVPASLHIDVSSDTDTGDQMNAITAETMVQPVTHKQVSHHPEHGIDVGVLCDDAHYQKIPNEEQLLTPPATHVKRSLSYSDQILPTNHVHKIHKKRTPKENRDADLAARTTLDAPDPALASFDLDNITSTSVSPTETTPVSVGRISNLRSNKLFRTVHKALFQDPGYHIEIEQDRITANTPLLSPHDINDVPITAVTLEDTSRCQACL